MSVDMDMKVAEARTNKRLYESIKGEFTKKEALTLAIQAASGCQSADTTVETIKAVYGLLTDTTY
jgi:hypothetical protein